MPLRTPNNPYLDTIVLTALQAVLSGYPTANTHAGLQGYPFYIQRQADLISSIATFPAIVLSASTQNYARMSARTWGGTLSVTVDYYDRWDQQLAELDTIYATLAADLERMKANIEDNEQLAMNNTAY